MQIKENFKEWAKAAGIRALRTFGQTAAGFFVVGIAVQDVNWPQVLGVSVAAAVFSLFTSLGGLPEVK